ncbi:MAG: leucine-rich repeat protein [Lachnospiraceae bacterium]|nr:leucine-rich repeat protein [Lachnospiraceae bacterium]
MTKEENSAGVETFTVAIVPSDEFKVVSPNPVRVKKGDRAEFTVNIDDDHFCVDTDLYKCNGDSITIDNVSCDRTYYIKTVRKCRIGVTEAKGGTVTLAEGSEESRAGDTVTFRLIPEENYVVKGLLVNEEIYPVQSNGMCSLTVNEDCTVRGLFSGVEKSFMMIKKNIGNVAVTGNQEDGCFLYGDELVFSVIPTSGIIFKGWSSEGYLKDGGKLISTDEVYSFTLTDDTEIYANFEDINTYSASFVSDDEGTVRQFAVLSADEYGELPLYYDVKPREGHILTGFNTKEDGSGDSYSLGAMFVMGHGDRMFYPEWTKCVPAEDLEYEKNGSGITIKGVKAGAEDEKGVICFPDSVEGLPVTALAAGVLEGNKAVKTVIVPPGIERLGKRAFRNCPALKTLFIPETLTTVGKECFAGCDELTDLRLIQSYAKIYELDYDAALARKYMRLKNSEGKRIILVGGSNLCFGINSEMIREAFPDYDVVNFSATYLYGLAPLLDIVAHNVREEDVVVICPEYRDRMFCVNDLSAWTNWEYVDLNPDILKDLDIKKNRAVLNGVLTYTDRKQTYAPKKKQLYIADPVYAVAGFNEYGDLTTKRSGSKNRMPEIPTVALTTDAAIKRINDYCVEIAEKGARCCFTFTSLSLGTYTKEGLTSEASAFLKELSAKLDPKAITVISDFSDYLFENGYFYDSCYHMTLEGAKIRTRQLIRDLAACME